MNWLVGGTTSDGPETPAHRWALNALKGVIMPETPFPAASSYSTSQPSASKFYSASSILKTPGTVNSKRANSVKFHRSVHAKSKLETRSGLPQHFPGKFPSPWTPKCAPIMSEENDLELLSDKEIDSPISRDKDQRERSQTTQMNPLKRLSLQLEATKHQSCTKHVAASTKIRQNAEAAPPLTWDLENGFDEVLESILKNNAYLQTLIDEMQECCNNVESSFLHERDATMTSDITINLDEPRSRSGQYWKLKFSDFAELTTKLKREQNNMQHALDKLRKDIEIKGQHPLSASKDRYDLLKEELIKERQAKKNSAYTKELRDLRKEVHNSRQNAIDCDELKTQLRIADLQISDLQQQIEKSKDKVQHITAKSCRKSRLRTSFISELPDNLQKPQSPFVSLQTSHERQLSQSERAHSLGQAELSPMNKSLVIAKNQSDGAAIAETKPGSLPANESTSPRRFESRTRTRLDGQLKDNARLSVALSSTRLTQGSMEKISAISGQVKTLDYDDSRPVLAPIDLNKQHKSEVDIKSASISQLGRSLARESPRPKFTSIRTVQPSAKPSGEKQNIADELKAAIQRANERESRSKQRRNNIRA